MALDTITGTLNPYTIPREILERIGTIEGDITTIEGDITSIETALDKTVYGYETVSDMQDDTNLTAGMIAHTNGFHSSGDGGAAWYVISASATANGMDVIALDNGLFAKLVLTESLLMDDDFKCSYHHSASKTDTSYILLRLPKSKITMSVHCANDNETLPTLGASPISYMESHDDFSILTSSSPWVLGDDLSIRLNGVQHIGTENWESYLCIKQNGELDVIVDNNIANISSDYVTVIPTFNQFIKDGEAVMIPANESAPERNPRNVLGWDDDYYYVFVCEGRGFLERGLTYSELQTLLLGYGVENAVNLDGGGSTFVGINNGINKVKVNRFKDVSLPYNQLRSISLVNVFSLKSDYKVLPTRFENDVIAYKNGRFGYIDFDYDIKSVYTEDSDFIRLSDTLNRWTDIPSTSRTSAFENQYHYSDYTPDATKTIIPIPDRTYSNHLLTANGAIELQIPSNTISSTVLLDFRLSLIKTVDGVESTVQAKANYVTFAPNTTPIQTIIPLRTYFFIDEYDPDNDFKLKLQARYTAGSFSDGGIRIRGHELNVKIKEFAL